MKLKSPTILSALRCLRILLTRKENFQWLTLVFFAFCSGGLEILTTVAVVFFARILSQPSVGLKYLSKIVPSFNLSESRIIFYAVLTLGFIYLIKNSVAVAESFYQSFTIQRMNAHFKFRLLSRYAQLDYGFYLTRNTSQGLEVMTGDVEQVFSVGLLAIAGILSESIVTIGLLSVLVIINPSLAIIILSLGAVFAIILSKYVLPIFYRWGELLQQESLLSVKNLMQFFHAFKEVILLGKQAQFVEICQTHLNNKSRIQSIQTATNSLPRALIEVIFMGFLVISITILCSKHETPANMMALLSGYLYAGFRLMPSLNRILSHFNVFKAQIPYITRLHHEYYYLPFNQPETLDPSFRFNSAIHLKDISFQYLNTKNEALKNVSLTIHKGECIGIVGETGSGKSTLVDLILGLLKPTSGTISIDKEFSPSSCSWHQKVGYVPQSIYLIDNTIEANIVFGDNPINEIQLNQSIDAAQLRRLIEQLPKGLQTIVGERGIRLSGGERQRIAIARALYRDPEVLIFDEATSALDTDTESHLMETIYQVCANRTVIMIAHRMSTLQRCNRIVVIEKGQIKKITNYANMQDEPILNKNILMKEVTTL